MARSKADEGETKGSEQTAGGDQAVSEGNGEAEPIRAKAEEKIVLTGADTSAIKKGSIVFYRREREVVPAIVLNKRSGDEISIVYFSENFPGRNVVEKKVEKGLKVGQWWSDLDELEAANGINTAKFAALIS